LSNCLLIVLTELSNVHFVPNVNNDFSLCQIVLDILFIFILDPLGRLQEIISLEHE